MDAAVELRLPYRAPCDVAGLVRVVAARAVPGVEQIDGDV
ncbi:MAG: AlkA N-terminal domain-containing protein, partial [Solirubrobacteraceae bacterium]